MSKRTKRDPGKATLRIPHEAIDRIMAMSDVIVRFAGWRFDALAKPDPSLEMARVQVEWLRWSVALDVREVKMRQSAGLAAADIEDRIRRMHQALTTAAHTGLSKGAPLRYTLDAIGTWLDATATRLDEMAAKDIGGPGLLMKLGALSRARAGLPGGNTRALETLVQCVENAVRWSSGQRPQAGDQPGSPWAPINLDLVAAVGLAARRLGIAHVALSGYAEIFPEHAAKLDRASLMEMEKAVRMQRSRTWDVAAGIGRARLGMNVQPESLQREAKLARREQLGEPQPAVAYLGRRA